MSKEFTAYEESLKLEQLGFDEYCFAWHVSEKHGLEFGGVIKDDLLNDAVLAPTYSQAFRFFREKFGWQHSIDPTADQHSHQLGYNYWIWNYKTGEEYHTEPKNRPSGDWEYETYEQAELACLKKLFKSIEQSNK